MCIELKKEVDIDFNIRNCCIKSVVTFIKEHFYFNNILSASMPDCFFQKKDESILHILQIQWQLFIGRSNFVESLKNYN